MEKLELIKKDRSYDAMQDKRMKKAAALWDSSQKLRDGFHQMVSGAKKTVNYIRDPNRPHAYIKWTMKWVDNELQTFFEMNESNLWQECYDARQKDAELKKQNATYQNFGAPMFCCSFLLETYLLLKFGIDMRQTAVLDPKSEEGKKLAWLLDHDDFVSRYKLTNNKHSIGARNPFAKQFIVKETLQ
ncbi:MAG: hypothetical protein ORN54_10235 [Cyclobacteriaceae bacterium]|nr:hypothetical protein [Cyclobacteriaceae bacterium]